MKEFYEAMKKLGMTCMEVGRKFDGAILEEGAVFETEEWLNLCYIFLDTPSEREIKAVSSGGIKLDIICYDEVIYFHFDADNILKFMAPFNMCLYSNFNLIKPENRSYIMPIILVDRITGIIKALRVIGYDNKFSKKLYELIKTQWKNGVSDFENKIKKVYDGEIDIVSIGKKYASLKTKKKGIETKVYN